ncbi:unnamed protein product, partial [Brenthis ino]
MMVLKVKNFCEREKRNNAPLIPLRCVQARVAAITGVSEKTVSKITKEGEVAASTSTKVSTPRKSGPRPKKIELDDFERRKAEMQNWISSNGLSYLPTMVKAQLFQIIKEHKQPPVYEADIMLEAHGHKVVRLPPYHCDLNPIELIWSVVKRRVAEKNIGQEANKILQITEEAFATITEEEWIKECEHVKKVEEKYYADGPVIDSEMERFIIEVGDDSDTSDDEDDEEDEVDDDLSGISPLDEHFLIDHNYNKKY